jgi:uncharacterized protein (TIGR02246 family)
MRLQLLALLCLMPAMSVAAQAVGDDAAIRARLEAHGMASAAGDARALSEVYADDAEVVSGSGSITRGRAAIDALWQRDVAAGAARGGRRHTHPPESVRIRFLATDIALVEVGSRSLGGVDSTGTTLPSSDTPLVTIWQKRAGTWRVVYQRAVPAPPPPK